MRRHHPTPHIRLVRAVLFTAILAVGVFTGTQVTTAEDQPRPPEASRHIGYGISVGPHLPARPDMLNELGLDWVKLYDTAQIPEFPNHNVLYRVDMRGYPADIEGWYRGLYDLARELQAAGVVAVEIGNEPNLGIEWGNTPPNPVHFTDGLCRAYRAFKATAPEIVVVVGGIAPTITTPDGMNITDFDYIQGMLNAGAGKCFDAFAYHPYGFNQPPEASPYRHELTFRRAERIYAQLWNNGIRDKQIWITEFGWVRDPAEEGLQCSGEPGFRDFDWMKFPAEVVASYTARAIRYAEENWSWVGPMFFWNLNWNQYPSDYEDPCSHLRWYAFLDSGGRPLPVYTAVANTPKRTGGPATNRPPAGPDPGVSVEPEAPRPPSAQYPRVGVDVFGAMTRTLEAGCGAQFTLGTFTVRNTGDPVDMAVDIIAANGPGRPRVWTNRTAAQEGDEIEIYVDARDLDPGLHLVAVNVRTFDSLTASSAAVRGWVLVHYPTSPECVDAYEN